MNKIIDALIDCGLILKKIEQVDLKEVGVKKRLKCFLGVDVDEYYVLLIQRAAKTRLLMKEAYELEEICKKIQEYKKYTIKKKVLITNSAICSKSNGFLMEKSWRLKNVSL